MQTLTGTEYLKCDIACKHDKAFEKATWDERLAHFATLDLESDLIFKESSNSIGLRAAVEAYFKSLRKEPLGYMTPFDAGSSGLQILSLLVSCPKSWNLCGGVSDRCVDSYMEFYGSMGLSGTLTRKKVKASIMTAFYGSTSIPEQYFGSNIDTFYATMEAMAPGAWDLNLSLQGLWDEIKTNKYDWVMPDNFHCCIETNSKDQLPFKFLDQEHKIIVNVSTRPEFHKGLGPNIVHSIDGMIVREMLRRCMFTVSKVKDVIASLDSKETSGKGRDMVKTLWDHYTKSGFLSVRILDYLNEGTMGLVDSLTIAKLIRELPDKPFHVVTVHDCFRCHPNYGNDLRKQYNIIMADINDSTMLKSIASQVTNKVMNTRKIGKIDRDTILNGNYLLS